MIFEHFALKVGSSNWDHKLGSTPFKDGTTLAPKLADLLSLWSSGSTPSKYWIKYSWSRSTHILYYIKMSVRWIHYLETRSCCVNMSFIILVATDTRSKSKSFPFLCSIRMEKMFKGGRTKARCRTSPSKHSKKKLCLCVKGSFKPQDKCKTICFSDSIEQSSIIPAS